MDNSSIIEGQVKFRDGKKWKSRWCVMRKLSPVADCLHLQLYRDSKDRYKQSQTKASLSLQYFLGIESGFTLDKESNTIAILCQDLTVVLAFDTRERLIQWQVKIAHNLGEDEQYLIQVVSAPAKSKVSPGPARLHIQDHRFSLTTGLPPRLAAVWRISHLRRYGVVERRFCFEGGSACGRYEGLYVLVTDQGEEITRSLSLASEGNLIPRRKPISRNMSVLESPRRMSHLKGLDDTLDGEEKMKRSLWESESSCDFADATSVGEPSDIQVGWKPERPIGRCISCMSKLGAMSAMSRSSTITPGIGFSAIRENSLGENQSDDSGCSVSNSGSAEVQSSVITSSCLADRISVVESGTSQSKSCHGSPLRKSHLSPSASMNFENYDVPRKLCVQIKDDCQNGGDQIGEYYDTPKKIKDTIACNRSCPNDRLSACLQQQQHPCCTPVYINKNSFSHSICHHSVCPCVRKVITSPTSQCPCFSNKCQKADDNTAVYAVVDLSKKIKNRNEVCSSAALQKEDGVNYENLAFVKSCEYYENVKDIVVWCHGSNCKKYHENDQCTKEDDYLLMGPVKDNGPGPGYLPMDKTKGVSLEKTVVAVLKREAGESKSASNTPCLRRHTGAMDRSPASRLRRRSNSMDSGRSLDESQSNAASTDSLSGKAGGAASLQALTKRLLRPCDSVVLRSCAGGVCQPELRSSPSELRSKASNRDSSSSNDSGVSTSTQYPTEFLEFETLVTPFSNVKISAPPPSPKRSKSTEPLQELSFQFSEIKATEAPPPLCPKKDYFKDLSMSSSSGTSTIPYIDSVSTSSGASDMSDYIETLSLSSYSSSDAQDNRLNHPIATVLKPRSGKEYHKIDRSTIEVLAGRQQRTTDQTTESATPGYVTSPSN